MGTVDPGPDAPAQAAAHVDAGARIIGVRGGPGSPELIAGLRAALGVPVAVLTGAPEVAEAAIDAGAAMVDASGGTVVAELVAVCARRGAGLIVPLGTPDTMTAALPPAAWMSGLAATAGTTRADRGRGSATAHPCRGTHARTGAGRGGAGHRAGVERAGGQRRRRGCRLPGGARRALWAAGGRSRTSGCRRACAASPTRRRRSNIRRTDSSRVGRRPMRG